MFENINVKYKWNTKLRIAREFIKSNEKMHRRSLVNDLLMQSRGIKAQKAAALKKKEY